MRFLFIPIILLMFSSCRKKKIHLYSENREKCITVINQDLNTRYIINGYTNSIPDTNYIKINLKNIDKIVDGFYGCWEEEGMFEWSLLLRNKEIIVENKLDTTKYKIFHDYKYDKNHKPVIVEGFKKDFNNCYTISFDYGRFQSSYGKIIVE